MTAPEPGAKYIVGWITLREGAEAEFDRIVGPYLAKCRAEPECRFFEMIRTREEPRTVLICESFLSEEAHAIHCKRQHMKDFFEELRKLALTARFENVIAREINPDAVDFTAQVERET